MNNPKMSNRAYLFTIVSYLLIFSLFLLAYNFYSFSQDEYSDVMVIKTMDKIAGINDDVATDLMSVFDINITVSNSTGNTSILLVDRMGTPDFSADLSEYIAYLTSDYQPRVTANMSFEAGNVFKISGTDIYFNYSDNQKSEMQVYGGDVTGYALEVIVAKTDDAAIVDRQVGGFPFYLIVGGFVWVDNNNPDYCNKYWVNFTDSSSVNVSMGACGEPRSLLIEPTGIAPMLSLYITTDYNENISVVSDSLLNISDWASGVNKSSEPVLAR